VTIPPGVDWSNMTIRPATGELDANEARIGDLALAPL
jgi:hypothetical protein